MQNESWMQPALQASEAVLLPALERRNFSVRRFGNRYFPAAPAGAFRPVAEIHSAEQPLALSTYVRPRGSMAGRSVLRAAGVHLGPVRQNPRSGPRLRANRFRL